MAASLLKWTYVVDEKLEGSLDIDVVLGGRLKPLDDPVVLTKPVQLIGVYLVLLIDQIALVGQQDAGDGSTIFERDTVVQLILPFEASVKRLGFGDVEQEQTSNSFAVVRLN